MFIPDSLSKLAKRATDRVAAYAPFKRRFEFIEACQLGKIKRIFPDVFQMSSKLARVRFQV
jgi:hypothetical protein